MCDRNEVLLHCARASRTLDSVQQLTQKDKVLWKGTSRGNVQEQGLSTPSVTLVSLQIGFVLVNERKMHKREKSKECASDLWLRFGSLHAVQNHVCTM